MKIQLVGKNLQDIRPLLPEAGFTECAAGETPELVISHGGDGAMLGAVREFRHVPLLPIRDAGTAPLCTEHSCRQILMDFAAGKLKLRQLPLVAGSRDGRTLYGVNDVFLHNGERTSALRYRVRIDGELYANEVVGDGVGIASVHGSTAYYRSITHSLFRVGVGLAFSNSTEEVNHLVLDSGSTVEIEIVRGPGVLIADNSPEKIELAEGDRVKLFQSQERAQIYGLEEFMCPRCRLLRHPNKLPFQGFFKFNS